VSRSTGIRTTVRAAVLATVLLVTIAPVTTARDRGPLAGPLASGPVSDGEHAAAWQPTADRVTALDTRTDAAVTRPVPAGCTLGDIRRGTILLSCSGPGQPEGVERPVLMDVATGTVREVTGWEQAIGVGSPYPPFRVGWTDLGRLYASGLVSYADYAAFGLVALRSGIPSGYGPFDRRQTITTDVAGGRRRLCRPIEKPALQPNPLVPSIDVPVDYVPPYALLDSSVDGGGLALYRCGRGRVRTLSVAGTSVFRPQLSRSAVTWSLCCGYSTDSDSVWIYLLRSRRRLARRVPSAGRVAHTADAVLAQSGAYPGPYRVLTRSLPTG
jgi:hypothetical protein